MNLTEKQQQEAQLESLQNQEARLKQEIEQFETQTKEDDPHAQRLLKRNKRMLEELQTEIKKLKPQTTTQGKK